MSATTAPRRPYEPALDGLRAFAVALVVWFHARPEQLPGGFLGVSVFFTLSGYLICRLVLDEVDRTGGLSLAGFWSRRYRRLIPASAALLLGVAAITALRPLVWGRAPSSVGADVVAAFAQVANWWFWLSGQTYSARFVPPSPVQHFWSLAVEEQFYLLFPLIVVATCRLREGRRLLAGVLAAATIGSWLVMGLGAVGDRIYYGTDARFAEIALGCLLALGLRAPSAVAFGRRAAARLAGFGPLFLLGLVALSLAAVDHEHTAWLYPWGFLATSAFTCAVIVAASVDGATRGLLARAPLPAIGRISYGIYLIHWPVLWLLTPARLGVGPGLALVVQLVLTLALAAVSFVAFEQPIRGGRRLARPALAGGAWLAAGLALLVWANFEVGRAGAPARWTTLDGRALAARLAEPDSGEVGVGREVAELPVPVREPDDVSGAERVLLLRGDSVGDYLAAATAAWARPQGLVVANGAKFSCSVASISTVSGERCPSPADDRAEVARANLAAVLWFLGVNDVFFEIDGAAPATPAAREAVVARLRARARIFLAAGVPVLINRVAVPAPLDPTGPYGDRAAVEALNESLDTLDAEAGIVVLPFDRVFADRPRDRLLRPDGIHTPDPKVGLALFEAGYGGAVLRAIEEGRRELDGS